METVLQCSPLEGSLEVNTNTLPFGKDWLYSPIQSFLDHMKDDEDADAERGLQFMKDSLNMLVSLEEQRLECKLLPRHSLTLVLSTMKRKLKFLRLMNLFSVGNDIFYDLQVTTALDKLLDFFLQSKDGRGNLELVDLRFKVEFKDLQTFIQMWTGDSFGNKSMGKYLMCLMLVGVQKRLDPTTKEQLEWTDEEDEYIKQVDSLIFAELMNSWHLLDSPPLGIQPYYLERWDHRRVHALLPYLVQAMGARFPDTFLRKAFIQQLRWYNEKGTEFECQRLREFILDIPNEEHRQALLERIYNDTKAD